MNLGEKIEEVEVAAEVAWVFGGGDEKADDDEGA